MGREERRDNWRALIEKHANSGMIAIAFCKEQKISPLQPFLRGPRPA